MYIDKENTLRETIREFLEDQLNIATLNEVQDFVLAKDFIEVNDKLVKVKQLDNSFRTVDGTFTLGMVEHFLGTPEAIKNVKMITYTIPIIFLVNVKENFNHTRESLERFVNVFIGNDFDVKSNVFATNADEISNTQDVIDINGIEFIKLATTVYITTSEDILIGNRLETYLGETEHDSERVYPIERNGSRTFMAEETQRNKEVETWTVYKESTWNGNLSYAVDKRSNLARALVLHYEEPTDLNKTWYLKNVYSGLDLEFEKSINFSSISLDGEIGNYVIITISMKRAFVNNG